MDGRAFFSVLNVWFFSVPQKEESVLFCSFLHPMKTKECSVLLKRTEKKGRNGAFLSKEWKRKDGTEPSFQKNGRTGTKRSFLYFSEQNVLFLSFWIRTFFSVLFFGSKINEIKSGN